MNAENVPRSEGQCKGQAEPQSRRDRAEQPEHRAEQLAGQADAHSRAELHLNLTKVLKPSLKTNVRKFEGKYEKEKYWKEIAVEKNQEKLERGKLWTEGWN